MNCDQLLNKVKFLQEELNKYKFDYLTGLPQRRDFENDFFNHFLREKTFYLTLIDIDDLHQINRDRGYKFGDLLIRKVANSIRETLLDCNGSAYRIGGDEFAILSDMPPNLSDIKEASAIAIASTDFKNQDDMFESADNQMRNIKNEKEKRDGDESNSFD
jgi:GGDEF domain-containing protein